MPLMIEGGRIPPRWAEKKNLRAEAADNCDAPVDCLRVALVNNVPDPALEDTEMQFFELLDTASGEVPVSVKLYSLPELPRGERGREHLGNFYSGFDELKTSQFDGVIITGTGPKRLDLRNKPYWGSLVDLLEWAEHNTASTVLSCLSAHSSVLHSDGIPRCPLRDKQFGVFAAVKVCEHPLDPRYCETGAVSPFAVERSTSRRPGRVRLRCSDAITGSRRRFVCEAETEKLVRAFSGSPRVWRADTDEGIPQRHPEISEPRTRDLPVDAARIL